MAKKTDLIWIAGVFIVAFVASFLFFPCTRKPKGAKVVTDFDPDKYLGKWYEIARFDFKYEKEINNTTAHYTKNEDGSIKVVNRGYKYKENKWSEAVGKAKLVASPNIGRLKVSFFGPFYSPYNVVQLDGDYEYALVVGKNTDYIWFLSRTPSMPDDIINKYKRVAESLGYDLSRLVMVEHGEI